MTPSVRRIPSRPRSPAVNAQPLKLWQDPSHGAEVRIELVPLIDVIFCILTFFILAAVGFSRQQAISLDLPQASTGAAQMRELIVISLDDRGNVFVEQQQVTTRAQLARAVEGYFLAQPEGRVVLRASRNATYDEVVQVLDLLREAGGDRIALATFPQGAAADGAEFETAPPPGLDLPGELEPFDSFDQFDPLNPLDPPEDGLPSLPADPSGRSPGGSRPGQDGTPPPPEG